MASGSWRDGVPPPGIRPPLCGWPKAGSTYNKAAAMNSHVRNREEELSEAFERIRFIGKFRSELNLQAGSARCSDLCMEFTSSARAEQACTTTAKQICDGCGTAPQHRVPRRVGR